MTTVLKTKTKVSSVVSSQVPQFVVEDYPGIISFLKAYYEWMEQEGNPSYILRNIENLRDIDYTLDEYIAYFKKQVMVDIPENIALDKRLLAKHIRELYSAKGTPKSYELLFRVLFNDDIELYYPKEDILRASNGEFDAPTTIKCTAVYGDLFNLVGQDVIQPALWIPNNIAFLGEYVFYENRLYLVSSTGKLGTTPPVHDLVGLRLFNGNAILTCVATNLPTITGSIQYTFASAKLESINANWNPVDNGTIYEFILNKDTIKGEYSPYGHIIGISYTDSSNYIIAHNSGILSTVNINNPGTYYNVSDTFDISGGNGGGFTCVVSNTSKGSLDGIIVEDGGRGYTVGDVLTFNNSNTSGAGAYAKVSDLDRGAFLLESSTQSYAWRWDIAYTNSNLMVTNDNTEIIAKETNTFINYPLALGDLEILTNTKMMFSVYCDLVIKESYNGATSIGIATHDVDLSNRIGFDSTSSQGFYENGDTWTQDSPNGSVLQNPTFKTGDTVDIAVDRINNLMWMRVNGGLWNNSITDNPELGIGGYSISDFSTNSVYPAISPYYSYSTTYGSPINTNGKFTLLTNTQYSIPTGFSYAGIVDPINEFLVLEDGSKLLPENNTKQFGINNYGYGFGAIRSIELLAGGYNYKKLPVVTCTTLTGNSAKLLAYSNSIGKITKINITNSGNSYTLAPELFPKANVMISRNFNNLNDTEFLLNETIFIAPEVMQLESGKYGEELLLEDSTEEFPNRFIMEDYTEEETLTPAGYFVNYNTETQIMTIRVSTESVNKFSQNQVIIGATSGARARIINMNLAEITANINGIGTSYGTFLSTKGMVSDSTKHMIDDYYYQDYSYVIKAGQSIGNYLSLIHI